MFSGIKTIAFPAWGWSIRLWVPFRIQQPRCGHTAQERSISGDVSPDALWRGSLRRRGPASPSAAWGFLLASLPSANTGPFLQKVGGRWLFLAWSSSSSQRQSHPAYTEVGLPYLKWIRRGSCVDSWPLVVGPLGGRSSSCGSPSQARMPLTASLCSWPTEGLGLGVSWRICP